MALICDRCELEDAIRVRVSLEYLGSEGYESVIGGAVRDLCKSCRAIVIPKLSEILTEEAPASEPILEINRSITDEQARGIGDFAKGSEKQTND